MSTETRIERPVYVTITTDESCGPSIRLKAKAASKTAAIAAARAEGYRVMSVGGNIGLETRGSLTGSDSEEMVWSVSVYE